MIPLCDWYQGIVEEAHDTKPYNRLLAGGLLVERESNSGSLVKCVIFELTHPQITQITQKILLDKLSAYPAQFAGFSSAFFSTLSTAGDSVISIPNTYFENQAYSRRILSSL